MDGEPDLIAIGELSQRSGVAVRTLRFYADRGFVVPATRSEGGYRLYEPAAVAQVALVRTLRDFGVDPRLAERMRMARPDLPEHPSPQQIEAWIELSELVADPDFGRRMREMSERGAAEPQPPGDPAAMAVIAGLVAERAGAAAADGVDPRCAAAAPVVDEIVVAFAVIQGRDDDPAYRAWLGELVATFTDARAERYWQLLAVINGWPPVPATVPAWEWLGQAL